MSETKKKREIVKTVTNATLFSDGTILLKGIRASYPHIFKAQAFEDGGDPSFSITGLLPKATHAKAKEMIDKEIAKLLAEAKMKSPPADKLFCRDGDATDKPENAGCWTVSAREKKKPTARNKANENVDSTEADMFYGGCWVNLLIRPWIQNNKFGKRVNANFSAIQFVKDDAPFGEGRIRDEDLDDTFDDISGAPDDEDDI